MLIIFLFIIQLLRSQGAPGCIDLKREYPELVIPRRPIKESDGKCPLSRTCCSLQAEEDLKKLSEGKLRDVLLKEAQALRGTLQSIKDMTAVQMKDMMIELVPADARDMVDISQIADVIWQYTLGEITAYELTVEVAVIGSQVVFNENADEDLVEMTECLIRELGTHATKSFTQIATVVEEILEPPRTFGHGFSIVESLINEITNSEFPEDCSYGELFACTQCGIRMPAPCNSACMASANNCLRNAQELMMSWKLWVDSITNLVDAMMLMKDIKIDPNELVGPNLVQELTNDIMSSMLNVNFRKCRKLEKRSIATPITESMRLAKRNEISEGEVLKSMFGGYFNMMSLEHSACKSASKTDSDNCWVGNYSGEDTNFNPEEPTRSHTKRYGNAETAVQNYATKVEQVIGKIHLKVRDQRSNMPIPDSYAMFSGSLRIFTLGGSTLVTFSLLVQLL